jgi:proton-dependent oligopeptide transporter, POT family
MSQDTPVGQPRGLSPLFFTEMWERFSFYGMRAFFATFMEAPLIAGGLGYDEAQSGAVLAMYLSTVYLMSLPGGWIADKYLGQRRAVFIGGVIIMIGHILLAVPSTLVFYLGLVALVVGTGFLKPNVSTMVGQLYTKRDPRRDGGFSIFYMGINVGAFVSPIICGYLAQSQDFKDFIVSHGFSASSAWHFGFAAAAIGMACGLVIFHFGTRALTGVGDAPNIKDPVQRARNRQTLLSIIGAIVLLPALLTAIHFTGLWPLTQQRIANVFGVLLLSLFLSTFALLYTKAQARERKGVVAMFTLAIGCIAFFALFEQAAGTMNSFAAKRTDNVAFGTPFPSAWYQSVNSVFIILLSPVFAWFFTKVAAKKLPFNDIKKFGVALIFMGLAFVFMLPAARATGLVSPLYLVMFYFMSTMGELFLSPVGLSSMSKLAPRSAGGLVMGVWFMSTANGDYLAGRAHGLTGDVALDSLFLWLAIAVFAVAAVMFVVGRYFTRVVPLESLMRSEEDEATGEDDVPRAPDHSVPKAQAVKGQEVKGRKLPVGGGAVSGEAIAGFATSVALWPVVLSEPALGAVILVVLGPSALFLAWRGISDARKQSIDGRRYALATIPVTLLAAVYAIVKLVA